MGSHIGSFPVMTKAHYLKASRATRFKYLFTRHPLTILFGYVFVFLMGMCIKPFLSKPKEHFDCLVALLAHIGIGIALIHFFGWQTWLLAQVIPHFITYAIGTYLFYAQHNFPGVSFFDKGGWTYEKAAMESSSYMKTTPVMAWFTANIGYHHIHHLNARIPFYRLPEVSREMPELQKPKTTSLNPFEIIRCLRLKIWDVEAQRMIPLPIAGFSAPSATRDPKPAAINMFTVSHIAEQLGGEVVGDGSVAISGIAPADSARAGDLTFAEKESYLAAAEQSAASAVLVPAGFESSKKVLIRVKNPRVAIARVLPLFFLSESHSAGSLRGCSDSSHGAN